MKIRALDGFYKQQDNIVNDLKNTHSQQIKFILYNALFGTPMQCVFFVSASELIGQHPTSHHPERNHASSSTQTYLRIITEPLK